MWKKPLATEIVVIVIDFIGELDVNISYAAISHYLPTYCNFYNSLLFVTFWKKERF